MATNTPTTRPSPVCPQATSSHPPPPTITPSSWPSSTALSASPPRLVMVLRSLQGFPASTIAELFGFRSLPPGWIQRCTHEGIAGLSDRPPSARLGSPRLEERIRRRLAEPQARRVARLWRDPSGAGSDEKPLAAAAASEVGPDPPGSPRGLPRGVPLRRRVQEGACWRSPGGQGGS
jgi:hypothetical protein